MFAGISFILNEEEGNLLLGMRSKEGEEVNFPENIKISDSKRIDQWLKLLENQMKVSMATDLQIAAKEISGVEDLSTPESFEPFKKALVEHSSQASMLSSQIDWTLRSEQLLDKGQIVTPVVERVESILSNLAEEVLGDIEKSIRKKYEQLITECVHQRDVARILVEKNVVSTKEFTWQYYMRFYFNVHEKELLKQLVIRMGNA